MVRAILDGRKTQTRRIVKWNKKIKNPEVGFTTFCDETQYAVRGIHANGEYGESLFKLPFIKADILYVRETFAHTAQIGLNPEDENYGIVYKADGQPWEDYKGFRWQPSLFMPNTAARIFLKITDIRVERLQEISEEDAKAEGVEMLYNAQWKNYLKGKTEIESYAFATYSFQSLWESINGEESWSANPWVWAIEFERIAKPE